MARTKRNFQQILALLSCSPFLQHLLLTNEDGWLVNAAVLHLYKLWHTKSDFPVPGASNGPQQWNLEEATLSKK